MRATVRSATVLVALAAVVSGLTATPAAADHVVGQAPTDLVPDATSEVLVHDGATGRRVLLDLRPDGRTATLSDVRWSDGWPVVVAVEADGSPGDEVLLHDPTDGRSLVVDVLADGRTPVLSSRTWRAGWDVVLAVEVDGTPGSEVLLYDPTVGRQVTVDLRPGGATSTLADRTWSAGWDTVSALEVDATPGDEVLLYDRTAGRRAVLDLRPDGRTATLLDGRWSPGWDVLVPVEVDGTGRDEVLVHSTTTGRRLLLDVSPDGSARTLSSTTWARGWSSLVPVEVDGTTGSELLLYRVTDGRRVIVDLRPDGSTGTLSDTVWSRGWDVVTPFDLDPGPSFTWRVRGIGPGELGSSWRDGCPTAPSALRHVTFAHHDFHGGVRTGELVLAARAVEPARRAFAALFAQGFPLHQVRPVTDFASDDDRSMAADNTSGFNCRPIAGTSTWSEHAFGLAIDVNPVENPYVLRSAVLPPAGAAFTDRSDVRPGMLTAGSPALRAFTDAGWRWGGTWTNPDHQHLELP